MSTDRIGSAAYQPVKRDDQRRGDGRHGTKEIAEHMEKRASGIEVVAVPTAAGEDPGGRDVGEHAGNGDDEEGAALNLGRLLEPLPRLPEDVDRQDDQADRIDERREDLSTQVAEGPFGTGRPAGQPHGEERQPKGGDVGEHVCRVGEKGQRVGDIRAGELYDEERGCDRHGDGERTPARHEQADRVLPRCLGRPPAVRHSSCS